LFTLVLALTLEASHRKEAVMNRERLPQAQFLAAGIAAPVIFTTTFIVQAAFRPGYSHVADPVSALAAGPNGWVQDANFFVTGALLLMFAVGVHRSLPPTRWSAPASAFLGISGLGLALAGVFPARDATGAFATNPAHVTAASLSFLGAGIGLALAGSALTGRRSRALAAYTATSGAVTALAFLVTGATAISSDGPLHSWLGVMQRGTVAVWFVCVVVLAVALRNAESRRPKATTGAHPRATLLRDAPVTEHRPMIGRVSTALLEAGDGPPIVLLHGQGGFAGLWLSVIPELSVDQRVVAPDLPGLGASTVDGDPLQPDEINDWLEELIEGRCPKPPTLVGISLGGQIAARFAADHSDRIARLVLVDTPGLTGKPRPAPAALLALIRHNARPTPASTIAMLRQVTADLDIVRGGLGPRWEPFTGYLLELAHTPHVRRTNQHLLRRIGLKQIPPDDLARITADTTLVWGRADRVTPLGDARQASATYGWPLHEIDAGHLSVVERPQGVLQALRATEAAQR
jgi:pimeloyl-ACP methyl ester carboxylesterase/hypothetical membrane protein